METKKHTRFEDLEDKYFGKAGTPSREKYELDLNMEMIGEKIKQLRLEKKMSQTELGELIGVKKAQISKLENGNHSATISTLLKVFHAMQTKIRLRIESDNSMELAF